MEDYGKYQCIANSSIGRSQSGVAVLKKGEIFFINGKEKKNRVRGVLLNYKRCTVCYYIFFYHLSIVTPTPTPVNRKPENSASQTTIVAVSCTLVAAVICVVTGFVWNRRKNRDKEVNKTLRDIPTQGNDLLCPSYHFACVDVRRNAGIDQPRNMQFPQGVRCRVERNFPNLTYYYYYYYYYYELFSLS